MKNQYLSTLIVGAALLFATGVHARKTTPTAPADSVLSVTETLVREQLIDSLPDRVYRTVEAVVDLPGIDSIGTYHTLWQVRRDAEYRTVTTRRTWQPVEVLLPKPSPDDRRGHYIQAAIGAGYGAMGYRFARLTDARGTGHAAGTLQLQYAYFFHPNWGISAGLGASTVGGGIHWNKSRTWEDVTDSNGERYDHTATSANWFERQRLWQFEIPGAIQFQKLVRPDYGLYAALGGVLSFPVGSRYWLADGALVHTGWYDRWGLLLHDADDFYTEQVGTEFTRDRRAAHVDPWSASVRGDFGFFFPVAPQWDLLVGFYGRYTLNNIRRAPETLVDEAWMHTSYEGDEAWRNHDFMGHEYVSLVETREVNKIRPWQAGLKIGVQWHYVDKRDHYRTDYEPLLAYDTVYDTRTRNYEAETLAYDTVMSPVEEIRRLMNKSIIWFDLDSYVPKIDPVDILDRMAEVLIANPGLRCEVNGHTCTIGSRRYNQRLSERRARAVADRLIALGVSPDQLECHGYCSDIPYFSESHQLYLDRRCEIIPIEETNEQHIIHRETKGKKN